MVLLAIATAAVDGSSWVAANNCTCWVVLGAARGGFDGTGAAGNGLGRHFKVDEPVA